MGETENPHFHDLWIFVPVPDSQDQRFLSLETPRIPQLFHENPVFILIVF